MLGWQRGHRDVNASTLKRQGRTPQYEHVVQKSWARGGGDLEQVEGEEEFEDVRGGRVAVAHDASGHVQQHRVAPEKRQAELSGACPT